MTSRKKTRRAAAFVTAAALIITLAGAAVGCALQPQSPLTLGESASISAQEAADAFQKTVTLDKEKKELRFTTPKQLPQGARMYLHVSGRLKMGDGWDAAMSFHAFEEESENGLWELDKTYTYPLDPEALRECDIDFSLTEKETQKELISRTIAIYGEGTPEEAADAFQQTILFDGEKRELRITIPQTIPEGCRFSVLASGTLKMGEDDTSGMSFHAFEEEEAEQVWEAGKSYVYPLDPALLLDCNVSFFVVDAESGEEYASSSLDWSDRTVEGT